MNRKYLPGQLVKVVANVTEHGFAIDQEVLVVIGESPYICVGQDGQRWFMAETELEPVTSSQTPEKS